MMNGRQYTESLKALKPKVFYLGKLLDRPYDHKTRLAKKVLGIKSP